MTPSTKLAPTGSTADLARFSEAIGLVYDCVLDPGLWRPTLGILAGFIDGNMASISLQDTANQKLRFSERWWKGDERWMRLLDEKYLAHYPFWQVVPDLAVDQPFGKEDMLALMPPDQAEAARASPFFTEWAMPANIGDAASVVFWRSSDRCAVFSVNTTIEHGPANQRDFDVIMAFAPHVSRAVQIGDLLDRQAQKGTSFDRAMEGMDHAALVVANDGRIVFANGRAEALLRDGSLIKSKWGRLEALYEPATAAIAAALDLAITDETALGKHGIGVPLAKKPVPAIAYVMPLSRRRNLGIWSADATAMILVRTGGGGPDSAVAAIAALYGLTPTEAQVSLQVARGLVRKETALALGMSDLTVKTHLGRIFAKTGVADQRSLALLFDRLAPPE